MALTERSSWRMTAIHPEWRSVPVARSASWRCRVASSAPDSPVGTSGAGEDVGAAALDEPAARVGRYDRAEGADLEALSPESRQARVASSHGFSQSTEDMLAKPARGATPARPTKGGLNNAPGKARNFKR
jgi:hypothetical protein